jgi:hypothetical protein
MKRSVVQNAFLLLTAGLLLPAAAFAQMSDKVAVIRIKAIDGLLADGAPVQVSRDQAFLAGSSLRVSRSAVGSLEGVKAIVLVDRRTDAMSGAELVKRHKEEVITVTGDTFTLKGVDGNNVTYALDYLSDGSVDLLGPSDRIIARGKGEFKVWKVESTSMMSRDRIALY